MPRSEAGLEARFCVRMFECGWLNDKQEGNEHKAGKQDRIFYGPGAQTVFVEFKRDGAREGRRGERLQAHRREELRGLGFRCYEARGVEQASAVFKVLTGEELYERRKKPAQKRH